MGCREAKGLEMQPKVENLGGGRVLIKLRGKDSLSEEGKGEKKREESWPQERTFLKLESEISGTEEKRTYEKIIGSGQSASRIYKMKRKEGRRKTAKIATKLHFLIMPAIRDMGYEPKRRVMGLNEPREQTQERKGKKI